MASVTETAPPRASVVRRATSSTRRWAPMLALTAIVLLAFALYTALASLVDVPRVHPDEVRYLIAGSSLVEGEGLHLRGGEYGFGPLYALVHAAILLVTSGVDSAYELFKAANALFFALTAVPVYLLARRLVSDWWAVAAAGLSVAIPSSISIATVMTESLAYLTAGWALLAIVRALEAPSVGRQLAMLVAVAAAFLTRTQFGALYLVWIGALLLVWLILPSRRPRTRTDLVGLWPSAVPLVLGGAVVVGRLATGSEQSQSFGAYWELWRGYDPGGVVRWLVYHLADFEIYLAVVPVAVTPIVLWGLLRQGRSGSVRAGAFAALFLAANAVGLFVVAAFNSTPYAYDRLHDRYAFYLLPLWLIVFVAWLADGLPRPLLAAAIGVGAALALPAILPFRQLANEAGIDTVPGALWLRIESELAGPGPPSGRTALAVFVLLLVAAVVALPARFRLVLPVVVLAVFVAMAVPAWDRVIDAPEDAVFAGGLERAWIDERVPDDAPVWKLYLESPRCPSSALTRHSLFATEFFNSTVDRAAYIGDSTPDGIPLPRVDVASGGRLLFEEGEQLEAAYVYTQPGIELNGERIATGTAANLVLWRVDGPVRIVGAETNEDVRTTDCAYY
ncbi:MAG: ArnT family glycosyltransferase [Gaiellaceae bacterium]